MQQGLLEAGSVGNVAVLIDGPSRDFIIALKTDIGTAVVALSPEDALRLGILLVRETGRRRVFHVPQPTEGSHANDDFNRSSDSPGLDPDVPDTGSEGRSGAEGGRSGNNEGADDGWKPSLSAKSTG
jgi:hypothetical protein